MSVIPQFLCVSSLRSLSLAAYPNPHASPLLLPHLAACNTLASKTRRGFRGVFASRRSLGPALALSVSRARWEELATPSSTAKLVAIPYMDSAASPASETRIVYSTRTVVSSFVNPARVTGVFWQTFGLRKR